MYALGLLTKLTIYNDIGLEVSGKIFLDESEIKQQEHRQSLWKQQTQFDQTQEIEVDCLS